jgi:uncharacterized protein YndB with AHSA1/START domain
MSTIIHLKKDLACNPAEAFGRFVRPDGWLCQVAEVEPWVGGKYELFWDPADRSDNNTAGCRITAFAPGELLAFDWRGPQVLAMNDWDPLTHVVVSFVATDAGTRVHLVHSGWPATATGQEARAWFERAWGLGFERL